METRRAQDQRDAAAAVVNYNLDIMKKNDWEMRANARLKKNRADRRLQSLMLEEDEKLERRRDKLRRMLADEHAEHMDKLAATVETPLERKAKMRQRVKQLRDARESARRAESERLKEEHFIQNCEPVRTLKTRKNFQLAVDSNQEMIKTKRAQKEREAEIEKFYLQMWQADAEAKDRRTERDRAALQQRRDQTIRIMGEQLDAKSEKERADHEAMLVAQAERLKLQEQRAEEDRLKREEMVLKSKRFEESAHRYNERTRAERMRKAQEDADMDAQLVQDAVNANAGEA